MRKRYLCLLLILAACPVFGQTFSARPIAPLTLTVPQQQRVRDSLLTLGNLRASLGKERRAWRGASRLYNAALDSLELAQAASAAEARGLKEARAQDAQELASQTRKTAKYQARATRRGFVNVLLSAVVAGLLYGFITR